MLNFFFFFFFFFFFSRCPRQHLKPWFSTLWLTSFTILRMKEILLNFNNSTFLLLSYTQNYKYTSTRDHSYVFIIIIIIIASASISKSHKRCILFTFHYLTPFSHFTWEFLVAPTNVYWFKTERRKTFTFVSWFFF